MLNLLLQFGFLFQFWLMYLYAGESPETGILSGAYGSCHFYGDCKYPLKLEVEFVGWLSKILKRKTVENSIKGCGKQLNEIWNIEDTSNFVAALSIYIGEKCQFGDNMQVLSVPERIFYIAQVLEAEVNNGGFSQFFYNSSGAFSNELVDALTAIGASATAAICQKAIDAFGREIPVDRDEREAMLDELGDDEVDEILEECDDAFYDGEDDLSQLSYQFAMQNRAYFT